MIHLYVMSPSSMYHDINDTHVLCLLQACIMIHLSVMPSASMYHDTSLYYAYLQPIQIAAMCVFEVAGCGNYLTSLRLCLLPI